MGTTQIAGTRFVGIPTHRLQRLRGLSNSKYLLLIVYRASSLLVCAAIPRQKRASCIPLHSHSDFLFSSHFSSYKSTGKTKLEDRCSSYSSPQSVASSLVSPKFSTLSTCNAHWRCCWPRCLGAPSLFLSFGFDWSCCSLSLSFSNRLKKCKSYEQVVQQQFNMHNIISILLNLTLLLPLLLANRLLYLLTEDIACLE